MTDPTLDARALLATHGLAPRKSRGQHFLVDRRVQLRVADACAPVAGETLVEIGPGLGALTQHLVARGAHVVAVELDRDLAALLRTLFPAEGPVEVVECDALRFDFAAVAARAGRPVAVVGNLPYQIQSPLLFRLVEARAAVDRMVFMTQREVAQRIVARPDTRDYGVLTVLLRLWFDAEVVCRVPPSAFSPAPRVRSAILRLRPLPGGVARVDAGADPTRFTRVVRAAFGQRRKTLRNALSSLPELGRDGAARLLEATAIRPERRAETLDLEEFAALARGLPE